MERCCRWLLLLSVQDPDNIGVLPPLMILGNKNDLEDERVISTEEGENFTRRQGDSVIFMETSAKKNTNIDKVRLRNGRRRLYRQFCVDI